MSACHYLLFFSPWFFLFFDRFVTALQPRSQAKPLSPKVSPMPFDRERDLEDQVLPLNLSLLHRLERSQLHMLALSGLGCSVLIVQELPLALPLQVQTSNSRRRFRPRKKNEDMQCSGSPCHHPTKSASSVALTITPACGLRISAALIVNYSSTIWNFVSPFASVLELFRMFLTQTGRAAHPLSVSWQKKRRRMQHRRHALRLVTPHQLHLRKQDSRP
jgi:hypothetical protein